MLIELIHPNGINTLMAKPDQVKRLKKLGWREANPEPVKEVVEFSQEIAETIEKKKQEAETPVDVKTETVAEDKPKPRNTTRKKPTTRRRKK